MKNAPSMSERRHLGFVGRGVQLGGPADAFFRKDVTKTSRFKGPKSLVVGSWNQMTKWVG